MRITSFAAAILGAVALSSPSFGANLFFMDLTNASTVGNVTTFTQVIEDEHGVDSGIYATFTVSSTPVGNYSHVRVDVDYPPKTGSNSGSDRHDFGFTYQHNGGSTGLTGGITYTLEFFNADREAIALPSLSMLFYDVDGQQASEFQNGWNQTEAVRLFADEGLVNYQLPQDSGVTADEDEDTRSIVFSGRQQNFAETDVRSMFIVTYENASKITIQMEAWTQAHNNSVDPVFTAIGDLAILTENGAGIDSFTDPIIPIVPEPSVALVALLGVLPLLRRRRN